MMKRENIAHVGELCIRQLKNWWPNFDENIIIDIVPEILRDMEKTYLPENAGRFFQRKALIHCIQ